MVNKGNGKDYDLGNIVYMRSRENLSQQDKLNESNYFSEIKSDQLSDYSHKINGKYSRNDYCSHNQISTHFVIRGKV